MDRETSFERRIRFSDKLWRHLEHTLPCLHVGRPGKNNRNFIEAVYFRFRTGIPWRDLPPNFGPWKTIYNRFNDWAKKGHMTAIFDATKKNYWGHHFDDRQHMRPSSSACRWSSPQ